MKMNEQLNQALVELIYSALDAKNFLVAELPEVIRQLLLWKLSVSLIITLTGIGCFVTAYLVITWANKNWDKICKAGCEPAPTIISLVLTLVGGYFIFHLDWLKIWLAPKVYLIEYMASLASK
jgi:hypothetical protein